MRIVVRKIGAGALLILTAWTLYALFSASQTYLSNAYANRIDWRRALQYAFLDSYLWAAITPFVFWIAGRVTVRRSNWWWTLPLLGAAGLGFALVHLVVFIRLLPLIGYRNSLRAAQTIFMAKFHSDVLTCWVLFGIRHAIEYYRRYQVRELKASQLEAKLALARLEVLKMQLQPHFLFNTLHGISALMYRDVEAADRMITRLSDFLRLAIDSAGVQEVTLRREMEYLDKYVEIEQARFEERLEVRRSIDPQALDLLVPNLILQPLVENAVRHGIAPRASGGIIDIEARIERDILRIEVRDDGQGSATPIREGVGLSNIRARLEQLYGGRARLDLGGATGGFSVRLEIPVHVGELHENPDR